MDELAKIRTIKHNEYLKKKKKEELLHNLGLKLEFNDFKRKICILTNFFKKYYIDKYSKSKLVSLSHTEMKSINGIHRLHLKNRRTNIIIDLQEFEYLKDKIPKSFHKLCNARLKKINNVIYVQDFEFRKCIFSDTKRGIGLNNPMIEELYKI